MVIETENMTLDLTEIRDSILLLINKDRLGTYYKVVLGDEPTILGSFFITWELNIYQYHSDWWF
jgi:hypothetical protein